MSEKKPVILVTAGLVNGENRLVNCPRTYTGAVEAAGGVPIVGAAVQPEMLADLCDGLLLTGGEDVDPARYNEEVRFPNVHFDPERDEFEFALAKAFMARKKPIMAICRGFQVLNAALGGKLYQDLPEELGFIHFDRNLRHYVRTEEGSILRKLFGESFRVNSTHHQSVRVPGEGLHITAYSPEGIVEGYEHESLPVIGTQFHPERLTMLTDDLRTPDFLPLFKHFVDMCR